MDTPEQVKTKLRNVLAQKTALERDITDHHAEIDQLHLDMVAVNEVVDALLDVLALT